MDTKKKYTFAFGLLIIYIAIVFFCCLYNFSSGTGLDLDQHFLGIRMDRVAHFLMFLPYSFLCWGFIKFSHSRTFFARYITTTVIVSGVIIAIIAELSQELLTTYRDSDPWDLVANISAIIVGIIIITIFEKRKRKRLL